MYPVTSVGGFMVPSVPMMANHGQFGNVVDGTGGFVSSSANQVMPQALFAVSGGKAVPLTPIFSGINHNQTLSQSSNNVMVLPQAQQSVVPPNNGSNPVQMMSPQNATARLMAPVMPGSSTVKQVTPVANPLPYTPLQITPVVNATGNTLAGGSGMSNLVQGSVYLPPNMVNQNIPTQGVMPVNNGNSQQLIGQPRIIRNGNGDVTIMTNSAPVRAPITVPAVRSNSVSNAVTNTASVQSAKRYAAPTMVAHGANQSIVGNAVNATTNAVQNSNASIGNNMVRPDASMTFTTQRTPVANTRNLAGSAPNIVQQINSDHTGYASQTGFQAFNLTRNNSGSTMIPRQTGPSQGSQPIPPRGFPSGTQSVRLAPGKALILPQNMIQEVKKVQSSQSINLSPQRVRGQMFVDNNNQLRDGNTSNLTVHQPVPNSMPVIANVQSLAPGNRRKQQLNSDTRQSAYYARKVSSSSSSLASTSPSFSSSKPVSAPSLSSASRVAQKKTPETFRGTISEFLRTANLPQAQNRNSFATMHSQSQGSTALATTTTPSSMNPVPSSTHAVSIITVPTSSTTTVATSQNQRTLLINVVHTTAGQTIPASHLMSILSRTIMRPGVQLMQVPAGTSRDNTTLISSTHQTSSAAPVTSINNNGNTVVSSFRVRNPNQGMAQRSGLRPNVLRGSTLQVTRTTTRPRSSAQIIKKNAADKILQFQVMNDNVLMPCKYILCHRVEAPCHLVVSVIVVCRGFAPWPGHS